MSVAEHRLLRGVRIPMPDGVHLAGDLHLPSRVHDGVRVPTLLQRTPYDRADPHETQVMTSLPIPRALDAGFAVLIVDVRGRHGSEGDFTPFAHEVADGRAVLAWVRAQPWSDAHVVGYGPSYVGAVQFLPPGAGGYDAILPAFTSADPQRRWARRGGAGNLGFLLLWALEALAPHDLDRRGVPVGDPRRVLLEQVLADPERALDRLPVLDPALDPALESLAPWLGTWPEPEQERPAADAAPVPALHTAGLHDVFLDDSLATWTAMRAGAAGERQRLVIGPWSHANRGEWQGRIRHGGGASAAAIDLAGRQLAFATAVLAGHAPAGPPVVHFVTGRDGWCTASDWPPPGADLVLHLDGGRLAASPGAAASRSFTADPGDPVPTCGGPTFLPGMAVGRHAGPHDQREIEDRDDVLVLRGDPLTQALAVVGMVRAELWCSSEAVDLDWALRLVDIDPDGVPLGVVDGIRRVVQQPGVMRVRVEIGQVSHEFGPGHRIGLQVAGSAHPRFDRVTHTGADPWRTPLAAMRPAVQTLHTGGVHPSRLILPVPHRLHPLEETP